MRVTLFAQTHIEPAFLESHPAISETPMAKRMVEEWGLVSSMDQIPEVAGRVCYQSFNLPNPKTATNVGYLGNIIEKRHFCYDKETQVLTALGWKSWPDICEADLLATRNEVGELEYHRPMTVVAEPYVGKMFRVAGRGVDLLVTPNHRMLACRTTTREGRKKECFELIEAQELDGVPHAYTKVAIWRGGDAVVTPAEARLIGFAIGDGWVTPSGNVVKFHLRRPRKIAWLRRLAKEAGWRLRENGDTYSIYLPDIRTFLQGIYKEDHQKRIPAELMMADRTTQQALFEGLMESDGSRSATAWVYHTTSRELADQVQQLALHVGLASNMGREVGAERLREATGWNARTALLCQYIVRRNIKPNINKSGSDKLSTWEDYDGMVYCATVPNGTLYVRRNGIPVWSGNSVFDHALVAFYVEDVSLSLLAEVTRHRHHGYSVESKRYADPRKAHIEPVIHPALRGTPEEQLVRDFYEVALERYDEIYEARRAAGDNLKQAREAARHVLLQCTGTHFIVSANVQGWRNMLPKRTSESADREIQELANELLRQLKQTAPNSFQDFEEPK